MIDQKTEWIDVDESKYNVASEDSQGVVIEMSVSPYDVPHYVRGNFDQDKNVFVIDFKYIDDETVREVRFDPHVSAVVGRKSGRVYSLLIDVEALGAGSVALKMSPDRVKANATHALSAMLGQELGVRRMFGRSNTKNYEVAKDVVGDYWNSLSERLMPLVGR